VVLQMLAVTIKPTDKSTEPSPSTAKCWNSILRHVGEQQIEALSKIK